MAFMLRGQLGRANQHRATKLLDRSRRWANQVREEASPENRQPSNANRPAPRDVPDPLRVLCSFLAGESAEFGRYGSPKWKTGRAAPRALVDV